MKVWEYLRDLKQPSATRETIYNWFYNNRIDYYDLLNNNKEYAFGISRNALDLDKDFKLNSRLEKLVQTKYISLDQKTIGKFLDEEIGEKEDE